MDTDARFPLNIATFSPSVAVYFKLIAYLCSVISLKYVFVMCMYNLSLKDELLSETRRSFDSEAAMDAWLQQQVEALLVAYNASQQAARRKARLAIAAMRRQSEENGNAAMTLDDINNEIRLARKDLCNEIVKHRLTRWMQ